MARLFPRRSAAYLLALAGLVVPIATATGARTTAYAAAPVLNLETLTGSAAEKMLESGQLTSVQLVEAYLARINALNKSGPGLNAVTQLNPNALAEAAAMDKARAAGKKLGPAMGLPILLKDIVDATPMYTSAGNYSLRNSFPAEDSGVAKKLRQHGLIILGKTGLSEFANSFGNQPSGFSNLTGQVINGIDADQNPSGSSSGSGAAGTSALAMFTIGTETSGSIISPSQAQGIVGLRPTVGLVPGYGIAPIDASQDTAGPMVRSVTDAAMVLQSIAGPDPESDAEYQTVFGPNYLASGVIPTPPATVPDYMSALDVNFVKGKRIGWNGTLTPGTPLQEAYDALVAAGAIMVSDPVTTVGTLNPVPTGYEQHKTIDAYYKHLGPKAPIQSLVQEVAQNGFEAGQALKFGNATHLSESLADITPGGANEQQFRSAIVQRKAANHYAIDQMMNMGTPDTSDDVIAVLGSTPSSPQAGYPQITIPMGYAPTTRRALAISVNGGAYDELNLIGVAYVIEHATHLRRPAGYIDPSMYRCAHTVPAEPYASRGHCNPDYVSIMKLLGGTAPAPLGFPLETTSAQALEAKLAAGTLTSEALVKAYLYRIALSNANGPATQAVRYLDPNVIAEAIASDKARAKTGSSGPLMGIPVLLDDSIDVKGMPTTGGSIALQDSMPAADSTIAANLKAAGAIILGKTNVTELDGVFDANIPEGYSSLGGQVLVPSDTDKSPQGSSAGSAAATASGLAAITVGMETSTDTARMIDPAGVAGVVGLKPTVGLVNTTGVLPIAKSQDSPGPIGRTVFDVALALNALTGSATTNLSSASTGIDYTAGLTAGALTGKRIGVVSGAADPYPAMVTALQSVGATPIAKTIGTATTVPSIIPFEFKRDLNTYLGSGHTGGAGSLQGIIDYNFAHPAEGLKYQQGELVAAQAISTTDGSTTSSYAANLAAGKAASQAVIDSALNNGTPNDPSDDVEAIMVPSGDPLVGIADRAGYPMLTIPAGYGVTASGAGHNPIGIVLVGTAGSEAKLLADGYALEKATSVRLAPSVTNPSMWRCVPGSVFFTAELCQPGDLELGTLTAPLEQLSTQIDGMGLPAATAGDLKSRLASIVWKVQATTEQCAGLGTGDFIRTVIGAASWASPSIPIGQAQDLVEAVNAFQGSFGCQGGGSSTPKALAEQTVLGLVGTVHDLQASGSVKGMLRRSVAAVGKQLAHNKVGHACALVGSLARAITAAKAAGVSETAAGPLWDGKAKLATELSC